MGSRADMHFPVVINGLDYLHSSVSSLAGAPGGRALKYAVLHLQFAAETLFKARLELHDPAQVWMRPEKFDKRLHGLGEFMNVGTPGALERLRDTVRIANPIDPEDAALVALVKLRNRLTHFGASDTAAAVEARAIPVLDLLQWFIDEELLPNDSSDTSGQAWELMETVRPLVGQVRALVNRRMEAVAPTLKAASSHTLRCLSCGYFAALVTAVFSYSYGQRTCSAA